MMYVTYDPATGALLGAYRQAPAAAHTHRIEVTDAAVYAAWVSYKANDARTALEALPAPTPAPAVPRAVTMRQARLALLGAGLLDDVETAINAMSDPAKTAARIEWDYSSELQRGHALVASLGAALGLTSGQVDSLFTTAAGL